MTNAPGKAGYVDILQARELYDRGQNVTEFLRKQFGTDRNTADIIEIAYDLQAGAYIKNTLNDLPRAKTYAAELAGTLDKHMQEGDTLLDVGSGELTTLGLILAELRTVPRRVLGFDISWSRLKQGAGFVEQHLSPIHRDLLTVFAADIGAVPLAAGSVDITTSSHALEPNGANLPALLKELFRVTRKKLVLFEPCYERNSEEGQRRMDRLGYIRGMEDTVKELGGAVDDVIRVESVANPLNPTFCFVISPPAARDPLPSADDGGYTVPGTSHPLRRMDDFLFSDRVGLAFPILKGIPVLRSSVAILASGLAEE